jgi:sec-independent protein translocase protein TatB
MHFGDSIFIFLLALVLFGPKRLPEIGRQIGKLLAEFRRASNDFKMQIDEELRVMEQQERQKQLEQAAAKPAELPAEITTQPVIAPPATGEPVSATSIPSAPMPTTDIDPGYMEALAKEETAREAATHSTDSSSSTHTMTSDIPSESEQASIHHG